MFAFLKSSSRRSARPRPARRLGVEVLEERAVPAVINVTPHHGIVIPNVQVETVYYGNAWTDPNSPYGVELKAEQTDLNQFFSVITNSTFMDGLAQYRGHPASVDDAYQKALAANPNLQDFLPSVAPGSGELLGSQTVSANLAPNSTVPTSAITAMLTKGFDNHTLEQPNDDRLYFVYLPPNVHLQGAPGFHDSFDYNGQKVFFAAIAHGIGDQPWRPENLTPFQAMTTISSHELVEAITDPVLGLGYVDENAPAIFGSNNEISDLGDPRLATLPGYANYSQFAKVDGYFVQQYWSNQAGSVGKLSWSGGIGIAPGGTQINMADSNNIVQVLKTMPALSGAGFTLHGQVGAVNLQFGKQFPINGIASKFNVTWNQRTDTYAVAVINGDHLELSINAPEGILFQGFMEAPGDNWSSRKEIRTVLWGDEPGFGLQHGIYMPGDFGHDPVSAFPFGMDGFIFLDGFGVGFPGPNRRLGNENMQRLTRAMLQVIDFLSTAGATFREPRLFDDMFFFGTSLRTMPASNQITGGR